MSAKSPIAVDVYVTPLLPTANGSDDPLKQWWSPTSLTLIHTAKSAIVVDTSATVPQTEEFADWIEQTAPGKQIKYFFTTHAHPDHFMGFPVLQKRFPGIKAVATSKVLEGIWPMYTPNWAKLWQGFFPNQVDATKHEWEALPASNELDLDGHVLKAYDVVQGDSSANSFLHVPSLDLVVAGDLVYGDCYQYLAEANTKEKRANWIKAVEQIESLKPKIVVPGHKRRSQIDGAYLTEPTKEYIRVFERELEKASSAEELEKRIIELYPERWNRFILERSCQSSFAAKTKKEQL
ncbi:hypothetical protein PRZ48_005147 [Zasmidium cellare]|uniref:Metallo-beta-lactamase domain-containing protein n=1 Tax=Zasmidium cellare TaxID=395010 RepID=A0ABR0ESZ1_ZASCE|nr:hypothetical protein PRZ48_005147 [Zasmidium cellare]